MIHHKNGFEAGILAAIAALLLCVLGIVGCTDGGATTQPSTQGPPINVIVAPMEQLVGAEGGTVHHASGAEIVIPPGALAKPTRITLIGTNPPSKAELGATPLGQGIEAGPDGQTFLKPIEVVLPFDPTLLPPGAEATMAQVRMAPHGSSDFAALQSVVDLSARVIRTSAVHFTQFIPALDPNPVFITTDSPLPNGTVGSGYSSQLVAMGGTSPYTFSLSTGSALPPGLTLASSGAITGTPSIPSAFAFFIKASDTAGHAVRKAFYMSVLASVNPVPTLAKIAPSSVDQGSATTTISLTGTGFVPTSLALFDGAPIATTFVSQTDLSAAIPASALANAGTHQVAVSSPSPGGGTSGALPFVVNAVPQNPVPTIASVSPSSLPVSNVDTQIVIVGTNFIASTSAAIGAQGISTSYVSPTQLNATIPASYLSAANTLQVGVYNPPPGGGFSTTTVPVTIAAQNPIPTLGSIAPSSVLAGSSTFTMTATGTGFVPGGQLFFNATALATTVMSPTSAQATVPASIVTTAGSASITFVNPPPGGGASAGQTFTISSGPGACYEPPILDPVNGASVGAGVTLPKGSFGCAATATPTAHVFELTQSVDFSMFISHSLNWDMNTAIQLRAGCDASSTSLLPISPYDCRTHYAKLLPGKYTFITCDYRGAFLAEPTPPAGTDTNTTCAAAQPLPYTETYRVYDASKRYFTFTAWGPSATLYVKSSPPTGATYVMTTGAYRLEVQSVCGDSATNVYDSNNGQPAGSACFSSAERPYFVANQLTAGVTYSVVLSAIDPGLQLGVRVGP